jgi:hypothetical protein
LAGASCLTASPRWLLGLNLCSVEVLLHNEALEGG